MNSKTLKQTACLIAVASLAGFGRAQNQPGQQPQPEAMGGRNTKMTELSQQIGAMQTRIQEIQVQLETITKKAMENTPELETLHSSLMQLYQDKLQEHGYPSDEELRKIQQLQEQLQAPGSSDNAERQKILQEFQAKVSVLQQAQQRAQQDPEVQKAFEAFEKARLKAMSAVDPNAPQLQKEMENLNQKIHALQGQLQQLMQDQR